MCVSECVCVSVWVGVCVVCGWGCVLCVGGGVCCVWVVCVGGGVLCVGGVCVRCECVRVCVSLCAYESWVNVGTSNLS